MLMFILLAALFLIGVGLIDGDKEYGSAGLGWLMIMIAVGIGLYAFVA